MPGHRHTVVGGWCHADDLAGWMGQPRFRVDAETPVDTGDQIARIDGALFDRFAPTVRLADNLAALETATGKQRRERTSPMTAAAVVGWLPLDLWCSAEFARPPDDRALKQAAVGQILQQGCHGLVHLGKLLAEDGEVVLVRIPALVVDRDVGHTAFHESPSGETRLPESRPAVAVTKLVVLLGQIEHGGPVAQNQVVGLVFASLEVCQLGVVRHRRTEHIERAQQLAPPVLPLLGDPFCNNPLDGKRRLGGIASRGERFVARAEEAGFREPSLWLRQDDVRWEEVPLDCPIPARRVLGSTRTSGMSSTLPAALAGSSAGRTRAARR